MRVLINIIALLVLLALCPRAMAQLKVCNDSPLSVETAIGRPGRLPGKQESGVISEGWIRVDPYKCETIIAGPLNGHNYYYYAETPGGKWTWGGDQPLCIGNDPFSLQTSDCDDRALRNFKRVDNGNESSFTAHLDCPSCLDSQFVRMLKTTAPFLEGLANLAAPLEYRTDDWKDAGVVDVQAGISRSALSLNVQNNQVSISTTVYYWLAASDTKLSDKRILVGSCGVNEPKPSVDVTVTSAFGITPEGKLVTKTWTNLKWGAPCKVTALNIDLTPFIRGVIEPQLNRLTKSIDDQIGGFDVSQFMEGSNPYR